MPVMLRTARAMNGAERWWAILVVEVEGMLPRDIRVYVQVGTRGKEGQLPKYYVSICTMPNRQRQEDVKRKKEIGWL